MSDRWPAACGARDGAGLRRAEACVKLAAHRLPDCDSFTHESGFLMQTPQVRPGLVSKAESMPRIVVFFPNSALGNLAIQLLTQIGIPNDRLGVTPPEQIEGGQGMILSIGCPDEASLKKVESLCRSQGGRIHRQRS